MASSSSQTSSSRINTLLDRLIGPQQSTDMKNPNGPVVAPATIDAAPPTYSEATASSPDVDTSAQSRDAALDHSDSGSSSGGHPKPPPDAQLARAPLQIETTNSKISGCYLVTDEDKNRCGSNVPHVFLKTTNAKIDAAVWADDCEWDGAFRVHVESTNGRIAAPVHTVAEEQAVNVFAKTTNATNTVYLPSDFKGTILLKTTNSATSLSSSLQPHSVRVPTDVSGAVCYEIRGSSTPSRAELRSTNGKICAAQVGDMVGESGNAAKEGGSCICM